jgi:hypothetical protein
VKASNITSIKYCLDVLKMGKIPSDATYLKGHSSYIFILCFNNMTRELIKLHNEELHDLYSSPSIIRIIKSRRMRWEGHVARMGLEEERV